MSFWARLRPLRRPSHPWTLLFMHIPKTAGSSMRQELSRLYRRDETLFLYDPSDLEGAVFPHRMPDLPNERRMGLRMVFGHFEYGLHEFIPRQSRYVTMVRDPVDRVISHYHHYASLAHAEQVTANGAERRAIIEEGLSLEDWVFERRPRQVDNQMVRQICARSDVPFGHCDDDMLRQALAHIEERFAQVLVLERMSQSLAALGATLGVSFRSLPRSNTRVSRVSAQEVDPAVVRRIRELNHLDVALCEMAVARLAETARTTA